MRLQVNMHQPYTPMNTTETESETGKHLPPKLLLAKLLAAKEEAAYNGL